MINILISVRRPFSGKILSREKPWELRKNAPRIPQREHVTLWLYESGKDGERAACRTWINREKRYCGNCRYCEINDEPGNICWECTRNGGIRSDNWEPRKEGE